MDLRTEHVQVETAHATISGILTLPSVRRLSDELNSGERDFLPLCDVAVVSTLNGEIEKHAFMAVNRAFLVSVVSVDVAAANAATGPRSRLAADERAASVVE